MFSKAAVLFYIPIRNIEDDCVLHSPNPCHYLSFRSVILIGEQRFHCGWDLLMTNEVEHLHVLIERIVYTYTSNIYFHLCIYLHTSLEKCLYTSFVHFIIDTCVFLLFSCKNY